MTDTSAERAAEAVRVLRSMSALAAERDALADRVDLLRDQVGRLTRERDEWEANAIEAMNAAALNETGDDHE